ncbi:40S small subunit processome assembly factor 1 isoform X3 [Dendrobates tinctorius]|uniref:40S small subunit processome assembly factor 1 isoform X3 n=1 Tax=Dendrobates tinctorius TaxID=92724 RepID=UPI003CC9C21D
MAEGKHPCAVREQLESVLRDLYDFGDDFVTPEENPPDHGQIDDLSDEKETEKVNSHEENEQPVTCPKWGKKNVSMFFDSMKEELCSRAKNSTVSSSPAAKPSTIQVVTFISRKDKKQCKERHIQKGNTETNIKETEEENSLQFHFEKLPKREYVNYKLYQESIKEKELVQKEKSIMKNGFEPARKKQKQGKNDRSNARSLTTAVWNLMTAAWSLMTAMVPVVHVGCPEPNDSCLMSAGDS